MSSHVPPPESHGSRVEQALYVRCRRGEPEALATVAYRLMDRLYTAASFVAPDEASATTAVLLAWEDTLDLLTGLRVGSRLGDRAMQRLGRRLGEYADRQTVARALHNAALEADDSLLPLPEEMVQPLVEAAQRHAPAIAAACAERRALRRRVGQSLAAAALLAVAYAGWLFLAPGAAAQELQLTCLQQRIVRAELIEMNREFIGELPDPQGANQPQARALQQASLALEEIANARDRQMLRYLAQRLQAEELCEQLAEMARDYEGAPHEELMQTQLVLEEVQAL